MSRYEDEYYIVVRPPGDEQVYIKADKKTAIRKYHFKKLAHGGGPLFFEDAFEDKSSWPVTDAFVDSTGVLVGDSIREEISKFSIDSMQLYPSIFIDQSGSWHEKFWYLGFYNELHCLDKKRSDILEDDEDEGDGEDDFYERLEVDKYALDESILDRIDEEKRLIFKMGGCSFSYIFMHKKIVDMFESKQVSGIKFVKVAQFEEGEQI